MWGWIYGEFKQTFIYLSLMIEFMSYENKFGRKEKKTSVFLLEKKIIDWLRASMASKGHFQADVN